MSNESLHVEVRHLRELAAKQEQAAAEIASAALLAEGVAASVRTSHGIVASASAGALQAVQQARQEAAHRIGERSSALSGGLVSAAERYRNTDDSSGADLDRQMPPTPPHRGSR
jgi:cytosine/adenosine deaminase-related metal-dependent hydrolase